MEDFPTALDSAILDGSADGVVVVDERGVVVRCNAAAEELLARPRDDLVGGAFELPGGQDPSTGPRQVPVEGRQGGTRVVEANPAEVTLEGRTLTVVTLRDITERSRMEADQRRLLSIVEATPNLVALADADGALLYMNPAGRRKVGIGPDEDPGGRTLLDLSPEWAREILESEAIPRARRHGSWDGETAVLGPDGREIPTWQVVLAHRSLDGTVEYLSTQIRDMTRLKEAQKAHQERVKELRTLYAAGRELARSDIPLESRLENVAQLLPAGWLSPEATEVRITWEDAVYATPGFRETRWMLGRDIESDGEVVGRVEVVLTDGDAGAQGEHGPFLPEEEDLLDAVAVSVEEAIRRQALHTHFIQVQKLETIGRLAGGIAHDFNNLLTIIQGQVELVLSQLPRSSPLLDDVQLIQDASDRGATLTRHLLAFGRRQMLEEQVFCLRETLAGLEPMLRRLMPERIQLDFDPEDPEAAEPRFVRGDPGKLEQVILNLAVNAADAIQGNGRITFSVREETMTRRAARDLPWEVAPGDYVRLVVSDDGEGMSPEMLDRVFEPFFTTKPEGEGTGLGLSMVFGTVKQSGGHIFIDSTPWEGTDVRILLPRVNAPGEAGHGGDVPARETVEDAEEAATVLLVEDDASVRSVAERMLARRGHRVLTAEDARQALEVARAYRNEIGVVLSDVVMPGMNGTDLVNHLREVIPGMRAVLMSGYAKEELEQAPDEGVAFLLEKPFSPQALDEAIRHAHHV